MCARVAPGLEQMGQRNVPRRRSRRFIGRSRGRQAERHPPHRRAKAGHGVDGIAVQDQQRLDPPGLHVLEQGGDAGGLVPGAMGDGLDQVERRTARAKPLVDRMHERLARRRHIRPGMDQRMRPGLRQIGGHGATQGGASAGARPPAPRPPGR